MSVPGPGGEVDVDVAPGVPAATLRRRLALLTGDAAWAAPGAVLHAGGRALDDAHPAGAPPLLPGAHATPGGGRVPGPAAVPPLPHVVVSTRRGGAGSAGLGGGASAATSDGVTDDVTAALAAGAHLAVVAGPDAGRLVPLPDGGRVRLPLGTGDVPPRSAASLGTRAARPVTRRRLTHRGRPDPVRAGRRPAARAHTPGLVPDPAVGPVRVDLERRGPQVRVRVRAPRAHAAALVRTSASTGAAGQASRRPVTRRRAVRWRPADELHVAGRVLRVRGDDLVAGARPRRPRVPAWVWSVGAPVVGAVVLASVLRHPLLLLTALTGVVGVLGAAAAGRRDPGDATAHRGTTGEADDRATAARATPTDGPGPVPDDVAGLRLATARALAAGRDDVPGATDTWPDDRTLVLVGARSHVTAAARGVALRTLGAGGRTHLVLRVDPRHAAAWRWTRWWRPGTALPVREDGDALVVVDGATVDLAAWRARAPHARLLVLTADDDVPAWAGTVVPVGRQDTSGRAGDRPAPVGAAVPLARERVPVEVAEAQARAAAALAWRRAAARPDAAPPAGPGGAVVLGGLPGVPAASSADVARAWDAPHDPRRLEAPLGRADDGAPVVLDLVQDGPHALVAGTTGSGKSELATTWVLGLALRHPPRRLAVLLVDFKGGTGLGPVAGLPHVVDHVHDLDVVAARRTLGALRAELRRREHLLAVAGRTDVADLDPDDPATPARLLVVVDELRALVEDLPDAAGTLARLAAQGRALGVHLVLATQRPAGAVPADLRANVGVRVALRVADAADSRDVLDVPDAAALDPGSPGRALLRVAARPPTTLQVARARRRPSRPPVVLADRSGAASGWTAATAPRDDVAAWVAACRAAARGRPGTGVPWPPALPDVVRAVDVGPPVTTRGLLVGLGDLPDEQRRAEVRWQPARGPLLVLGGPGSGRSTTLTTVGEHALAAGLHVHAVGLPADRADVLRAAAPHALGTVVAVDDDHRAGLLLERLLDASPAPAAPVTPAPRSVLLVDGLDVLLERLAGHAQGHAADLLIDLLRRPPAHVHLAASGPVVPALTRLLDAFPHRLVLPVVDPQLDAQAGVPRDLTGPRAVPGRAVARTPDLVGAVQVVLPAAPDEGASSGGRSVAPDGTSPVAPDARPVRIGRLPTSVHGPGAGRVAADVVPLGVGGDAPAPVGVDATRPLVVAGPPGSGRTATLRTLARAWAARGRRAVLVAGSGTEVPPGTRRLDPADAGRTGSLGDDVVLLVDDADELERHHPGAAAWVDGLLGPGTPRVVALATTTEHAAAAFRGPVASALRARQVLVLDPHGGAARDLLGPAGARHADPRERPRGRAVLRRDHALVRVQVHAPPDVGPARTEPDTPVSASTVPAT